MLYCVQEAEAIVIADDDDASPVKRSKQPQRTKRRVLEDDDEDAQEEEGKARAPVCPKKEKMDPKLFEPKPKAPLFTKNNL